MRKTVAIAGGVVNDRLRWHGARRDHQGTPSIDSIAGTADADTINAGPGDNIVNGLGGNDTINGGPGRDSLRGGVGDDFVQGAAATTPSTSGVKAPTVLS